MVGEIECVRDVTMRDLIVDRNERVVWGERSRGAFAVHKQLLDAAPDQVLLNLPPNDN